MAPVGPVGPCSPCGPVGPCVPVGPVGPATDLTKFQDIPSHSHILPFDSYVVTSATGLGGNDNVIIHQLSF